MPSNHDDTSPPNPHHLRKALIGAGIAVLCCSATALAFAAKRIVVAQAASSPPSPSARCTPSTLNRSAVLPGTSLAVSPLPDSFDASPQTQISLLGAPASELAEIHVTGSQSGGHSGRLEAYSQGDGASFVPSTPFAAGETVSVRGRFTVAGKAQTFAFHFVVSVPDKLPYSPPATTASTDPGEEQSLHTMPTIHPPSLVISTHSPAATPGDIFSAPYTGHSQAGPMILDEAGNLVWFDALPTGSEATNLQVQQLNGVPVLTWWQGYIPPQGFGEGEEVIDNSDYQQIGHVRAGNGLKADLHDFHLLAGETAVLTVFDPIHCNLSSVDGPSSGAVTNAIFQEIDLRTGLVRREWTSLDHVPLSDSYSSAKTTSTKWPFDYFHVNSIDRLAGQPATGGRTLISARNTWALYELNTTTGQILLRIGGKHSEVKLAGNAATAFQHDATVLENGTISVFDNGGVPMVHPESRGLVLAVDPQAKTGTNVAEYEHSPALSSGSQGNIQQLSDGDMFVGWGAEPYFSEYSASGQLLFDGHMHGSYESYRTYRFPWVGTPTTAPAIAAVTGHGGTATVYASWNGATKVASWRVLAGSSPTRLTAVATAARDGFETALTTPAAAPYVEVQALEASGAILGSSPTIKG
jgi:hypothetical protein